MILALETDNTNLEQNSFLSRMFYLSYPSSISREEIYRSKQLWMYGDESALKYVSVMYYFSPQLLGYFKYADYHFCLNVMRMLSYATCVKIGWIFCI